MPKDTPGADWIVFGRLEDEAGFCLMAYDIPGQDDTDIAGTTWRENGATITDRTSTCGLSTPADPPGSSWVRGLFDPHSPGFPDRGTLPGCPAFFEHQEPDILGTRLSPSSHTAADPDPCPETTPTDARVDDLGHGSSAVVGRFRVGIAVSVRVVAGRLVEDLPAAHATLHNERVQQRFGRLTTTTGDSLAYTSIGTGRPLVYVTGWLSHLQLSWEVPEERAFYESLAQGCRLVRYDRAGCGLSAPSTRPPSMAHELDQLAAVTAPLGPETFDLIGTSMGALVAVAWAAAHPDTVRRLVLYGGWVCGADISPPSAREHVLGLVESHWGLGSDVLTDIFAPDAPATMREKFGRYQRACSTAATARALLAMSYELDVSDLLARVRTPTLVVHRAHDRAAPVEQARALAGGIAGAQLVVLPGRSHLPYAGDADALVATVRRFLGLPAARRGARTLTARQYEVAALISDGCTNREVAARLGIDERSAEGHAERIRLRLGFRSRAQIAAWYAARRDRPDSTE